MSHNFCFFVVDPWGQVLSHVLSPEVTKLFHTVQGQRAARVAGDRRGRTSRNMFFSPPQIHYA